jgi:hypothetical protein
VRLPLDEMHSWTRKFKQRSILMRALSPHRLPTNGILLPRSPKWSLQTLRAC